MRRASLIALLLMPATAFAQASDTTAVPRDLVNALLSPFGISRSSEIIVRAVPPGIPRDVLPSGGEVLGGVVFRFDGIPTRSSTVIVRSRDDASRALASWQSAMEKAGWTAAPVFERSGGGFVGSPFDRRPAGQFCKDSANVNGTASRAESGSLLRITFQPTVRNTSCDPAMRERMTGMRSPMSEITLPELRPPVGVVQRPGGGGGGSDYRDSRARMQTDMSLSDLMRHFVGQITDQGWTEARRVGDDHGALATFRKRDEKSREMYGMLTGIRLGGGDYDFVVRVVLPSADAGSGSLIAVPRP